MEEDSAETDAEGLDIFSQEQWASLRLDAATLRLRPEEQLQVHMDCLNAVGEIVTIEDVDDMGGSVRHSYERDCWLWCVDTGYESFPICLLVFVPRF